MLGVVLNLADFCFAVRVKFNSPRMTMLDFLYPVNIHMGEQHHNQCPPSDHWMKD